MTLNEKRAAWRAAGLCTFCGGKPMKERVRCRKCVEYFRAYFQTPEYKTWNRARYQIPEYKALVLAHQQKPEVKARNRAFKQTPKYRAQDRARGKTPKRRAWIRACGHKRRARLTGNGDTPFPTEQFEALCRHFNNRCIACGRLDEPGRERVPDHIISVKLSETVMLPLGFLGDIDNLQPLCHGLDGCNNKKGWRKFTDYRTNPHPDCLRVRAVTP